MLLTASNYPCLRLAGFCLSIFLSNVREICSPLYEQAATRDIVSGGFRKLGFAYVSRDRLLLLDAIADLVSSNVQSTYPKFGGRSKAEFFSRLADAGEALKQGNLVPLVDLLEDGRSSHLDKYGILVLELLNWGLVILAGERHEIDRNLTQELYESFGENIRLLSSGLRSRNSTLVLECMLPLCDELLVGEDRVRQKTT
jgi:hypothetical protein